MIVFAPGTPVDPPLAPTLRFSSFDRFDWVLGLFWAKNGYFGAQNAQFWEGTSRLGAFGPKLGFGKGTT